MHVRWIVGVTALSCGVAFEVAGCASDDTLVSPGVDSGTPHDASPGNDSGSDSGVKDAGGDASAPATGSKLTFAVLETTDVHTTILS